MREKKLAVIMLLLATLLPVMHAAEGPAADDTDWEQRAKSLEKRLAELEERVDELTEAEEEPVEEVVDLGNIGSVSYTDGFQFESNKGELKLRLGGWLQNDWAFMRSDGSLKGAVGPFKDGTEIRRARVYMSGLIYDSVEFRVGYDLAGNDGDVNLGDAYMGLIRLPLLGNVRVGRFKEPFSMEALTYSQHTTFMERSLAVSTFAPMRNTGIMIQRNFWDQRVIGQVGLFHATDDYGKGVNDGQAEYDLVGRLAGVAYQNDDGDLLHLGGAYHFRRPEGDVVRYTSKPEANLAPAMIDSAYLKNPTDTELTQITAEHTHTVCFESALLYQEAWLHGEYMHTILNRPSHRQPDFSGFSVSGGVFLTGEQRGYENGHFARTRPNDNFLDGNGGLGAWEVAARYSYVDLNDGGFSGGILRDFTFGVNWYLNPYARVMGNYILADKTKVGDADIFMVRFQIDY